MSGQMPAGRALRQCVLISFGISSFHKKRAPGQNQALAHAYKILIFQAAKRDNINAILASVCVIPRACQNHQERRLFHFVGIDFSSQSFQVGSAFFNQSISAQLDFHQPIGAVPQMNNRITFQPLFVPVMVNFSIQSIGKTRRSRTHMVSNRNPKVFKSETKSCGPIPNAAAAIEGSI